MSGVEKFPVVPDLPYAHRFVAMVSEKAQPIPRMKAL